MDTEHQAGSQPATTPAESQRYDTDNRDGRGAGQPAPYSQQDRARSGEFVGRDEFETRVGALERTKADQVEVTAPQVDPETVAAATAAAMGQPDPNVYPTGVDPHGRNDGTGLATEGNEPPKQEQREGFFKGF